MTCQGLEGRGAVKWGAGNATIALRDCWSELYFHVFLQNLGCGSRVQLDQDGFSTNVRYGVSWMGTARPGLECNTCVGRWKIRCCQFHRRSSNWMDVMMI